MRLLKPLQTVYAHCDIPCGIYDPHNAQVAALTVIRMMDLITESGDASGTVPTHNIARLTAVKEEHAELCKQEIRIIWGDYFKENHFAENPDLNGVTHKVMELASKARQGIDRSVGVELLGEVNKFAEIFWKTKEVETRRAVSPYSIEEEIVYPIL